MTTFPFQLNKHQLRDNSPYTLNANNSDLTFSPQDYLQLCYLGSHTYLLFTWRVTPVKDKLFINKTVFATEIIALKKSTARRKIIHAIDHPVENRPIPVNLRIMSIVRTLILDDQDYLDILADLPNDQFSTIIKDGDTRNKLQLIDLSNDFGKQSLSYKHYQLTSEYRPAKQLTDILIKPVPNCEHPFDLKDPERLRVWLIEYFDKSLIIDDKIPFEYHTIREALGSRYVKIPRYPDGFIQNMPHYNQY